jgi:spore coat polysaccharide biosynthesis protein SpsF
MKFHGFITVRVDSSRLPEKTLLRIGKKRVIDHIIERAKSIKGLDGVVVCTSDRPQDDVLETIANEHGVLCYRGPLEDKLERWRGAAETFGADYIITIDGDDPFCDPELCETAIAQIREERCEFLQAPKDIACGAFTYGIKRTALEKVCEIKDSSDTEMMWVYFTDTDLFKVSTLQVPHPIFLDTSVRLTLDYPEDLEFFRQVFDDLSIETNTLPLREILLYLKKNPKVKEVNFFRQGEFLANQAKNTHLKLK